MAQLWGGRFTKETDQLVYNFNASISFDRKFFGQDIEGSIAHVVMLAKQGILTKEEKDAILKGLTGIRQDVEEGKLAITEEYEDIHSFVEAKLIERIGEAGKKLHTGRSRNDQVALDMRLYTRLEVLHVDELVKELLCTLLRIMEENTDTYMPGFTHLQKAQPVTLAHHVGAYFEMFKRDRLRLKDIYHRMNYCPLGAGALAGTTYPLDRNYTASLLGFEGPTLNSMDSVADRDYIENSVDRTARWLVRCKAEMERLNQLPGTINRKQMLFGINQGGIYEDIRIRHAQEITKLNLDGYAIGGLAVGESHEEMYRILEAVVPHLPAAKPTYLMGVGTPANILEAVERGVDFFDCVYPTRNGRHGHVYTNQGKLNLFNQKYAKDVRPIEEGCQCPACRRYSRAYIRHLLKAKEMLGMRLCALHNLYFYNTMMEEIREAIEQGRYHSYKEEKLYGMKGHKSGGEEA